MHHHHNHARPADGSRVWRSEDGLHVDVRGLDDPAALLRLDALDKKIASRSLQRKLDPDAPLFIDFEEHVRAYEGTDRSPVYIRR